MKTLLFILLVLSLASLTYSQTTPSQSGSFKGKAQFYASSCPGDSLSVLIYSTNEDLMSTLIIPDDAQLAIFADSIREYKDLNEFRGIVMIRSMACKNIPVASGQTFAALFESAPIQVDLKNAFVIVYND
jgi:hypothetical protein